jgi:photosystem II stability/assembly factor-like uncharacterized protein
MKGDFSRLTFDRKKHYSGVLMQQGRVLIDADWNEQLGINRHLAETVTMDVIGPSGAPAANGLKILPHAFARGISVVRDEAAKTRKGWLVGEKAAILYWDGKAFTFQAAPDGISTTLQAVYFVDEKNGWAVGDNGVILHTKDGGAAWIRQQSRTSNDLRSVYFVKLDKEIVGCIAGEAGTLLYSNNSGKNWLRQDTKIKGNLNALHILILGKEKGLKIFAVGDQGTILEYLWDMKKNQLDDAAAEFQNVTDKAPDLYAVNSTCYADVERAYAVGEMGAVFIKYGRYWNAQESGVDVALKAILVIRVPDTGDGGFPYVWAVVAENGAILVTGDTEKWKVYNTRLPEKVLAVDFIDWNRDKTPMETVVLGNSGGAYGQGEDGWVFITNLFDALATTPGRIYVDGILCEFDAESPLPLPPAPGKYMIYLDVWRRHITALQDPQIRENALCGPDTCTRVQTISLVKYLPLVSSGVIKEIEGLRASAREAVQKLKELTFRKGETEDAGILNQATAQMLKMTDMTDEEVITHLNSDPRKIQRFVKIQKQKLSPAGLEKVQVQMEVWEKAQTRIINVLGDTNALSSWEKLTNPGQCALKAEVQVAAIAKTHCTINAVGGYQGLENQLYRVEIHAGSDDKKGPTFKWSRDNGSVIFPFEIDGINDNKTIITLTTPDLGSYYPIAKEEWIGVWVEVIQDDFEMTGKPGILLQVADVSSDTRMTLDGALDTTIWSNKDKHPIIRRWDQREGVEKSGAVSVKETTWMDLESGVRIWFETDGTYRTGDYWVIPARTETGDVEWPQSGGQPAARPPRGIRHHYSRLALLTAVEAGKNSMMVTEFHDCRQVFPPLADHALHVVGINWKNDSFVPFDGLFLENLVALGFQIILDDSPDSWTVNPNSVIVTVEMVNGLYLVIEGDVKAHNNVISWRLKAQGAKAIGNFNYMNAGVTVMPEIGAIAALTETPKRIRITLKGRLIWKTTCGRRIYLDGQVFGQPRYERDDNGDRIAKCDIILPSGAGDRGSDFESWLHIRMPAKKTGSGKRASAEDAGKDAPNKGKKQ